MRKLAAALVASFGVIATAAGTGEALEMRLAWDACGAAGPRDRSFACDSNAGSDVLAVSFVAPSNADAVIAVVATLTIGPPAGSSTLPPWWDFKPGDCRAGQLVAALDVASGPCQGLWLGGAVSGWREWTDEPWPGGPIQGPIPGVALLKVLGSMSPSSRSLVAGQEYGAFRLVVSHQGTTGTGACAGCASPLSITLQAVELDQVVGAPTLLLTNPSVESTVTWQGGGPVVPVAPTTWGAIKSLYR